MQRELVRLTSETCSSVPAISPQPPERDNTAASERGRDSPARTTSHASLPSPAPGTSTRVCALFARSQYTRRQLLSAGSSAQGSARSERSAAQRDAPLARGQVCVRRLEGVEYRSVGRVALVLALWSRFARVSRRGERRGARRGNTHRLGPVADALPQGAPQALVGRSSLCVSTTCSRRRGHRREGGGTSWSTSVGAGASRAASGGGGNGLTSIMRSTRRALTASLSSTW